MNSFPVLYESESKRPRISPDVIEVPDPHFRKDMFDLSVSAHMCTHGPDVKSCLLDIASLLADVDKESEMMALSLFSSAGFEEAFPEISNCED